MTFWPMLLQNYDHYIDIICLLVIRYYHVQFDYDTTPWKNLFLWSAVPANLILLVITKMNLLYYFVYYFIPFVSIIGK